MGGIVSYQERPAESDKRILEIFYAATRGQQWARKGGWMSNVPLSMWEGVIFDNGHVTQINLGNNALIGSIAAAENVGEVDSQQ